MRKTLLTHADGMFRWVEIWLEICLAPRKRHMVRTPSEAERLLNMMQEKGSNHTKFDKLKLGYMRLWDIYRPQDSRTQESRIRLFHISLAVFQPQNLQNLRDALGIQEESYEEVAEADIEQWCSGFLVSTTNRDGEKVLRWVHASAKSFILDLTVDEAKGRNSKHKEEGQSQQFSERNNHLAIANMYLYVVGNDTHPMWNQITQDDQRVDIKDWIYFGNVWSFRRYEKSDPWSLWKEKVEDFNDQAFLEYLILEGLRHCRGAAEKASIFDPTWRRVLDKILLSTRSAFGFTEIYKWIKSAQYRLSHFGKIDPASTIFRKGKKGNLHLLRSRIVLSWNIIHEEDVNRLSPKHLGKDLQPIFADWADESIMVVDSLHDIRKWLDRSHERTVLEYAIKKNYQTAFAGLLEYAKNDDVEWFLRDAKNNDVGWFLRDPENVGSEEIVRSLNKSNRIPIRFLMRSAAVLQRESMMKMLLDLNINVQAEDLDDALQAVSLCSEESFHPIIKLLLKVHVNLDIEDKYFGEALFWASQSGSKQTVKMLLDEGADPNHPNFDLTPLLEAVRRGDIDIVDLLLERGAIIDTMCGDSGTALHAASNQGHLDIVSRLLEAGANVNVQCTTHGTALQVAAVKGHLDIVNLLLEKNASIDAHCGWYDTALQEASAYGHLDIVDRLLEAGADVNMRGREHGTALQAAAAYGHLDVVNRLLEARADV